MHREVGFHPAPVGNIHYMIRFIETFHQKHFMKMGANPISTSIKKILIHMLESNMIKKLSEKLSQSRDIKGVAKKKKMTVFL